MARRERRFAAMSHDAAAGVALISAAFVALFVANSGLRGPYEAFLATPMAIQVGAFSVDKPLLRWINDGLMALFFLFVSLELKRELLTGRLASPQRAALPAAAAVGGVAIPAMVYSVVNQDDAVALQGWAIPAATDIVFALGLLALLGARAPTALKVFLLAVAIMVDVMAILIIALFYTSGLSMQALGVAAAGVAALAALNRMKVAGLGPYLIVGLVVWAAVLKSGVHATLAGVIVAMAIPIRRPGSPERSPVAEAELWLKPWILFLVMPAFAFANAGIPLAGLTLADLLAPLPLGIAMGLFVGNQIGVFACAWLAVNTNLARLPDELTWRQIYGASLLSGVGFTMSLFIGTLAFDDPAVQNAVRLGVLTGSLVSGLAGYALLRFMPETAPTRPPAATQPASG